MPPAAGGGAAQKKKLKEIGQLVIVCLKARNLPDKHNYRKQDPYCVVILSNVGKRATKAHKGGGQHPDQWAEEQFIVPLYEVEGEQQKMVVQVWRNEPTGDEMIGEGSIVVSPAGWPKGKDNGGEYDEWVPLGLKGKYTGEAFIEMTFYPPEQEAQKESPPPSPAPPPRPALPPQLAQAQAQPQPQAQGQRPQRQQQPPPPQNQPQRMPQHPVSLAAMHANRLEGGQIKRRPSKLDPSTRKLKADVTPAPVYVPQPMPILPWGPAEKLAEDTYDDDSRLKQGQLPFPGQADALPPPAALLPGGGRIAKRPSGSNLQQQSQQQPLTQHHAQTLPPPQTQHVHPPRTSSVAPPIHVPQGPQGGQPQSPHDGPLSAGGGRPFVPPTPQTLVQTLPRTQTQTQPQPPPPSQTPASQFYWQDPRHQHQPQTPAPPQHDPPHQQMQKLYLQEATPVAPPQQHWQQQQGVLPSSSTPVPLASHYPASTLPYGVPPYASAVPTPAPFSSSTPHPTFHPQPTPQPTFAPQQTFTPQPTFTSQPSLPISTTVLQQTHSTFVSTPRPTQPPFTSTPQPHQTTFAQSSQPPFSSTPQPSHPAPAPAHTPIPTPAPVQTFRQPAPPPAAASNPPADSLHWLNPSEPYLTYPQRQAKAAAEALRAGTPQLTQNNPQQARPGPYVMPGTYQSSQNSTPGSAGQPSATSIAQQPSTSTPSFIPAPAPAPVPAPTYSQAQTSAPAPTRVVLTSGYRDTPPGYVPSSPAGQAPVASTSRIIQPSRTPEDDLATKRQEMGFAHFELTRNDAQMAADLQAQMAKEEDENRRQYNSSRLENERLGEQAARELQAQEEEARRSERQWRMEEDERLALALALREEDEREEQERGNASPHHQQVIANQSSTPPPPPQQPHHQPTNSQQYFQQDNTQTPYGQPLPQNSFQHAPDDLR